MFVRLPILPSSKGKVSAWARSLEHHQFNAAKGSSEAGLSIPPRMCSGSSMCPQPKMLGTWHVRIFLPTTSAFAQNNKMGPHHSPADAGNADSTFAVPKRYLFLEKNRDVLWSVVFATAHPAGHQGVQRRGREVPAKYLVIVDILAQQAPL